MYATTDLMIEDDDPMTHRVIGRDKTDPNVKLYIGVGIPGLDGGLGVVMSARSLVTLRGVIDAAVNDLREIYSERWAELFPPELDLETAA